MISSLVEAAIRSIGVALIVGMGLRLFRVRNVLAQKAAWSLVLAAAMMMPIAQSLPRSWQGIPVSMTVHLPAMHMPATVWRQGQAAAVASLAAPPQSRTAAQQFQGEPAVAGGNHFPEEAVTDSGFNPPARAAEARVPVEDAGNESSLGVLRLGAVWDAVRRVRPIEFAWGLYCAVTLALLLRLSFGMILAARIWLGAERVALDAGLGIEGGGWKDKGLDLISGSRCARVRLFPRQ